MKKQALPRKRTSTPNSVTFATDKRLVSSSGAYNTRCKVTFVVLPRLTKTALTVPYPGALKTAPDLADLIVVGTSNGI